MNRSFRCDACVRLFTSAGRLKQHRRMKHGAGNNHPPSPPPSRSKDPTARELLAQCEQEIKHWTAAKWAIEWATEYREKSRDHKFPQKGTA